MPDTSRFRVLAHPRMVRRANGAVELDSVEFFASREDEATRIWRVGAEGVTILFDIMDSQELASELICELHDGTSVALPGDYSPVELVLLGYRIPIRKPPQGVGVGASRSLRQG